MYYVYRDFSIAGWLALANFILFASGAACGRRRCQGLVSWLGLAGVAIVSLALVFGARYYLAMTQDVSLQVYFRFARMLFWTPASIFFAGLTWGWYASSRTRSAGRGFQVLPPDGVSAEQNRR